MARLVRKVANRILHSEVQKMHQGEAVKKDWEVWKNRGILGRMYTDP